MRAWTAGFVKKNLWKVRELGAFEDLMQDCWLVFARCAQKYDGVVDNPAWFMSLYQQAIRCEFMDMAKKSTNSRHVVAMSSLGVIDEDGAVVDITTDRPGELQNEGELRVLVKQAPSEVKAVLAIMLNAPSEVLEVFASAFRTGVHSQANRRLCMFIGIEETDLLGRVREYFG